MAIAIDVLDVCAAASQVRALASAGDHVLVLGAGHAGKLAMAAARDSAPGGTVVAVDVDGVELEAVRSGGLCDVAVAADLRDPLAAVAALREAGAPPADLTVVVVNATGCEPAALLLTARGRHGPLLLDGDAVLGGGPGGGRDRERRADADRQRLLAGPGRLRPPPGARAPRAGRSARRDRAGAGGMSGTAGHRVQMRWRDIDPLGHVNHNVALTYLEEGRDAFLRELGIGRDNYVVGRCSLTFAHEIRPEFGSVTVECEVAELGRSSVTTRERIVDPDGNVVVEGTFGLVLWDPEAGGARPIGDAERAALSGEEARA